jgi:hypothetical protein
MRPPRRTVPKAEQIHQNHARVAQGDNSLPYKRDRNTRRRQRRSESEHMAKLKNTFPRITKLCDNRTAIDVEPGICILWKRDSDRHASVEIVITARDDGSRPHVSIRSEDLSGELDAVH